MARRNRVSVPNGTYHITSRIVNKEHLLRRATAFTFSRESL